MKEYICDPSKNTTCKVKGFSCKHDPNAKNPVCEHTCNPEYAKGAPVTKADAHEAIEEKEGARKKEAHLK